MGSYTKTDVVIIGAGPAGISAAIYLLRAGVNVTIIEKDAPGGTLNKITNVDNYPGYTEQSGSVLSFRMYNQLEALNATLKKENVMQIKKEDNKRMVITDKGIHEAKYVIIATGKTPRKLEVEGAYKFENKGISYCVICDGTLNKGKDVAIIGGGNAAMQAAIYMSNIAKNVYVINRSDKLRAAEKEQKIIEKLDNVKVIYNANVSEINGESKIESIKLDNDETLKVESIFVCIGQELNSFYFEKLNLDMDKAGIIVDENMATSDERVFACGDIISKGLYQIVTAVNDGAIAATSVRKKLKEESE